MKDEPRKVIMFEETDGDDDNGRPIERIFYGCPTCGKHYLLPYADRCPGCNQVLKW